MSEQIKKILAQLADHETRISALEGPGAHPVVSTDPGSGKQKTLREIVKGRKFKNGQQQIAVIVGYHEKILGIPINKGNIKSEWTNAKITNKYSTGFITRAKDALVRVHPNGTCDLTQAGEELFEKFLKNEPIKPTSQ